jgi:hypothetical protein
MASKPEACATKQIPTIIVSHDFSARFPVASLLLGQFCGPNYKETKHGAILSLPRDRLQCRSYKLGDAFLERVDESPGSQAGFRQRAQPRLHSCILIKEMSLADFFR